VALLDRVLVKNEAAAANNGIYVVTTLGTVSVAYILTRAADMNQAAEVPGAFAFTEQGTVNGGAGFTVAGTGPYVIGTTAINWTQFSGAGEIAAGTGLTKSGNTLSLTPINDPLQLGLVSVLPPWATMNTAMGVSGVNNCWYLRCSSGGYAISNIGLQVATSNGNVCVAAYQASGTGASAVPAGQYQTSGSVACPATGSAVIALGGSCTPKLADYLALASSSGTATFYGAAGISSAQVAGFASYQTSAFPCPASAAPTAAATNSVFALRGS
jgi:hypothetical protein